MASILTIIMSINMVVAGSVVWMEFATSLLVVGGFDGGGGFESGD